MGKLSVTLADELRAFDHGFDNWNSDRLVPKELFDRVLARLEGNNDMIDIHFLLGYMEGVPITHDCRNADLDCYRVPVRIADWIGDAIGNRYPDAAIALFECGITTTFAERQRKSECREIPVALRDRVISVLKAMCDAG